MGSDPKPVTSDPNAGAPTPESLYEQQMSAAEATNGATPTETATADERLIVGGVDLTGVQLTPEQVEALEKAALRQSDYTKKTQKLAEERKAIEAKAKKAEIAEKLERYFERDPEALKILTERMMGTAATPNGTSQPGGLPANWDEMTDADQTVWVIQNAGHVAASTTAPRIQALEEKIAYREKLDEDESKLYEAHPEAAQLESDDPLVELTDKLYDPSKGISLTDAFEEASRLLGRATEKVQTRVINAQKKAAASLAKPANNSNDDGAPDPKAFKRTDDYYDAVKQWSLNQMRRI